MKILIGPGAPSLIEQGFGDLVNCERYQFLLDTLVELYIEDGITDDQFDFQVEAIASNIMADIEEQMRVHSVIPLEQCVYVNSNPDVVH